jgi:hypothetical protein
MKALEFRDGLELDWPTVTSDVKVKADEPARLVEERRR